MLKDQKPEDNLIFIEPNTNPIEFENRDRQNQKNYVRPNYLSNSS